MKFHFKTQRFRLLKKIYKFKTKLFNLDSTAQIVAICYPLPHHTSQKQPQRTSQHLHSRNHAPYPTLLKYRNKRPQLIYYNKA